MDLLVFVVATLMVFGGAVGVVVSPHPVHAVLSLVLTLFGVAVMFVAQDAHFLAAVQVVVYAGAVVVLFLFVIMLLGVDRSEDLTVEPLRVQRPLALVMGAGLVTLVTAAVVQARDAVVGDIGAGMAVAPADGHDANIRQLGRSIFSDYVFAFELTSVLLVVAVAGTVLMTRRVKRDEEAS